MDALMLKLPVVGSLIQAAIVERICRVLASLVIAGVDLPRAMAVTAESSNNAVYSAGLNRVREQMMEGRVVGATGRDRAYSQLQLARCFESEKRPELWTSNSRLRPPFTTGSSK